MVRCPPAAPSDLLSYPGYRFPVEIISHAAWYFRFSLTLRDVEEILAERGVQVSYETVGAWCAKFGPSYAADLRRRRVQASDFGTWMGCNSRSRANATGCGGQSTIKASSSTSWCSNGAINSRP